MGIAVPGAIAAALVASGATGRGPDRRRWLPHEQPGTRDGAAHRRSHDRRRLARQGYGLIDWKQGDEFGRPFGVEFGNPDLVAYAESFGIAGFRPESAADLYPTLKRALDTDGVSVVDVPIDYAENARLTERLGMFTGEA